MSYEQKVRELYANGSGYVSPTVVLDMARIIDRVSALRDEWTRLAWITEAAALTRAIEGYKP